MSILLTETVIDIDGKLTNFDIYGNGIEYEIDSDCLPDISIAKCIKSLRKHSRIHGNAKRPLVELIVRLVDSDRSFWENKLFGIYINDKYSYYRFEFMANASIGMQEDDVKDIVSSHIHNTDFTLQGYLL